MASEHSERLEIFRIFVKYIKKPKKEIYNKVALYNKIEKFYKVDWYKSCIVWILGDHPQSLKILMLDSVIVPWGKGEKEFVKLKRYWNLMLTSTQSLLKLWGTFCIMDQQVYFSGELK